MTSAGSADLPRSRHGDTVLVVDDETSVRMLVADVLGDLGYAALEAADGVASLAILRSDVRIDFLVTDVGLPGGMNGREVADAACHSCTKSSASCAARCRSRSCS